MAWQSIAPSSCHVDTLFPYSADLQTLFLLLRCQCTYRDACVLASCAELTCGIRLQIWVVRILRCGFFFRSSAPLGGTELAFASC